jgi:protein SCO1
MTASKYIAPVLRAWMLGTGALIFFAAAAVCSAQTNASCCAKAEADSSAGAVSEMSVYQTDSTWTADTGKEMKLAELKGRPQVLVMFFASCQSACPILVQDLKRIEASLPPPQRSRVGFTLVTIDPRRDTPQALAHYRQTRALPPETWTLLHGEPDDIRELAALIGLKYKEQSNGQFAHSNLITVLNEKGEIVHQLIGLGQDIKPAVTVIEQLLAEGSLTPAAKGK